MARNEEKQQGKLNRLWLQKEREEGRIRDVHERRPKLSTLSSPSSVKKWIPSIKNEIEYYLQQSQLSHYPERKIAEFQLHMEALEKEYKSFIRRLRALDPACKHHPWTPRSYCKKRAETPDSQRTVKHARRSDTHENGGQWSGDESDLASAGRPNAPAADRQGPEARFQTPVPTSQTSKAGCADQDQPLRFDRTRLAVAAAAYRGPSVLFSSSQTQSLARALQAGLPNLNNSPSGQIFPPQANDRTAVSLVFGQKCVVQELKSDCEEEAEESSNPGTTGERTGHVLGLDCYSSSDEDCDT